MNPFFVFAGIFAAIGTLIQLDKKQAKNPEVVTGSDANAVPTSAPPDPPQPSE